MRRLRLYLIIVIAWLVLVFNLERPDNLLQMGNNLDLSSVVYILAAILVATILMNPDLSYTPSLSILSPTLVLYAIGKYGAYQIIGQEIVGSIVILEVSVLILSIIFARRLAGAVLGFEQTVNSALLGRVGERILDPQEYGQAVSRELLRARQYKHPASLLYIRLTKSNPLLNQLLTTPQGFQNRYMLARIVEAVSEMLTEYNLVGWYQNGLVIYLPEMDRPQVVILVSQLYELLNHTFGLETEIGVASFPKDALIYEDLIVKAQTHQIRSTQELKALVLEDKPA